MTIKLIVAVDGDNAIGWQDGRLPWRIPADLKRFKELTTGHVVVMGRKTFDSLQRPNGLPHRHNVVLTRGPRSPLEDIVQRVQPTFSNSLLAYALAHGAVSESDQDLWIIGGAEIYKLALELKIVDEIYLTVVGARSAADVKFPYDLKNLDAFNEAQAEIGVQWTQASREEHATDEFDFAFIVLRKKT